MTFEPMHKNLAASNLQRQMFQKNFGGPIASPTDNLMSPCSQKLSAHKNKFYNKCVLYLFDLLGVLTFLALKLLN